MRRLKVFLGCLAIMCIAAGPHLTLRVVGVHDGDTVRVLDATVRPHCVRGRLRRAASNPLHTRGAGLLSLATPANGRYVTLLVLGVAATIAAGCGVAFQ
jgi:hypothetical protein